MLRLLCVVWLFASAVAFGLQRENSGRKLEKVHMARAHKQPALGNLRKADQVEETTEDDAGDDSNKDQDNSNSEEEDDTVETVSQPDAETPVNTESTPKPAVAFAKGTAKPVQAAEKSIFMKASESKNVTMVSAKKESPELAQAKADVQAAQADIKDFNDDEGFNNENARFQTDLAKETESRSLASILTKIRSEVRTYAGKAAYGPQLEAKLEKAQARVKDLEGEVAEEKEKIAEKETEEEDEDGKGIEWYKQEVTNKQHAFSTLLLLLTFTQIAIFGMVSGSNNVLKKNTWTMVNTMAVVVIASTSFHVISILFEEFTAHTHMAIFSHVAYALVMFSVAVFGSYKLRNDPIACTAFKAVIFWLVLLAKGGAIGKAQDKLGDGPTHTTAINFACLGSLVLLVIVAHIIKKFAFHEDHHTWYDDVEAGLCGGAFGGSLAFLAHHWIDHHFPPDPNAESFSEQALMNIIVKDSFAAFTCLLAVTLTNRIASMQTKTADDGKYWYARFLLFVNATIGIMPYFACSVGSGDWLRHQMGFHAGSTGAHLIATAVATFWGFVMILAVSFVRPLRIQASQSGDSLATLMLGFGGFLAGYNWAALTSDSIAKLNHGWGWSESEHHMFTIISGLALNVIAIPVFYHYLSPVVAKASELKDDLQ
jgi:hypothetical protein